MSTKALHLATEATSSISLAESDELQQDIRNICESPVVGALLQAVDGGLLVLNESRRILAANTTRLWPSESARPPLGLLPGEALECRFGGTGHPPCGSAGACQDCGLSGAIFESQRTGQPAERDALFSKADSLASLEVRVRAVPITVRDRHYFVVSLRDVSSEKRRESLEQVFFHDLMNTVSALSGWTWTLTRPGAILDKTVISRISRLIDHLGREVGYQRALLEAERGTLKPERVTVDPSTLLAQVQTICSYHAETRKCSLIVENRCAMLELSTDPLLLERVLVNMIKNAFEATPAGGTVRIVCEPVERSAPPTQPPTGPHSALAIAFRVYNDAVISERVAMRIFQRSFSTKPGKGRGLGTYSMRLLGERYLGGRVGFSSRAGEGTVFFIELDLASPAERRP